VVRLCDVLRTINVGFWDPHFGRIDFEPDLIRQRFVRMRVQDRVCALRGRKVGIVDEGFAPNRKRQDDGAITPLGSYLFEQPDLIGWRHVGDAFTVMGYESIPINQASYALRSLIMISDARDHHAAIAVPHKDNVTEIISDQVIGYLSYCLRQSDSFRIAGAIAHDCWYETPMPGRRNQRRHWLQILYPYTKPRGRVRSSSMPPLKFAARAAVGWVEQSQRTHVRWRGETHRLRDSR
jgi:hypothetical protein